MGGGLGSVVGGALVTTMKLEESPPQTAADAEEEVPKAEAVLNKDVLCPICIQVINDAFLTSCGHNFCYMCIVTHLNHKSDCPCGSQYLIVRQLYPNFLLKV